MKLKNYFLLLKIFIKKSLLFNVYWIKMYFILLIVYHAEFYLRKNGILVRINGIWHYDILLKCFKSLINRLKNNTYYYIWTSRKITGFLKFYNSLIILRLEIYVYNVIKYLW